MFSLKKNGIPRRSLKNVWITIYLNTDFRVTVNIFWGPATSWKVTLKSKILELNS